MTYARLGGVTPMEEGMLRAGLIVGLLLCCCICMGSAHAENGTALHVFGFSHDGRYFAFEQSVLEDGSGVDVDEILIIDTETDTWVTGTPISVRIEEGDQRPGVSAQAQARAKAKVTFEKLGIDKTAPHPIARNAAIRAGEYLLPMEVRGMRDQSVKHLAASDPILGGKIELSVTDKLIAVPKAVCEEVPEGFAMGFRLDMADKTTHLLHEDDTLPKSRGYCPLDYGIAAVYLRQQAGGGAVLVVVMDYYGRGWEGPDRRFLAVSAKLPLR